jgi:hypothetical protein
LKKRQLKSLLQLVRETLTLTPLEPHPAASEENKGHFNKLKSGGKHFKEERNTARSEVASLKDYTRSLGCEAPDDPAQRGAYAGKVSQWKIDRTSYDRLVMNSLIKSLPHGFDPRATLLYGSSS